MTVGVKVVYGAWFGGPWPNKRNAGWLYARVWKWPFMRTRIYIELPRHEALKRNANGSLFYEGVLRHELEHIYQRQRVPFFSIRYSLESLVLLVRHFSVFRAYYDNSFEVAARESEKLGLTKKEEKIFTDQV